MEKVKAVMSWLLKPEDKSKQDRSEESFTPAGINANYAVSIRVASFDGPEGATVTKRIISTLSRVPEVKVKGMRSALHIPNKKTAIEGLIAAAEKGRDWLKREQAEVLVWGQIDPKTRLITMRFLPVNGAPEGRPGAIGMGDVLELPLHYSPEVDDVIAAAALCAGASTQAGSRESHTEQLRDLTARVVPLGAIEIPGLDQVQLVSVLQTIANVITTDARGSQFGISKALEVYLRAIRLIPSDLISAPRQALMYSQYGAALLASGAKSDDIESFEKAVEAYRSAIGVLSMSSYPHDWALNHIRLGLAIYQLAQRKDQAKFMGEAIKALEKALVVYTRGSNPGRWAEVKNHIGIVMSAMGEALSNNEMLERAIEAFDDALDVRKREIVVVQWAQTTNNMGAAAFALAKRTEDMALMQQAAYAFQGAIEVYRQIGQEQRAHIIQKNLNRVQAYLGSG